jgi:hypothetical protein
MTLSALVGQGLKQKTPVDAGVFLYERPNWRP